MFGATPAPAAFADAAKIAQFQAQAKTLAAASTDAHHGSAIFSGRLEQIQLQLGEANAKRAALEIELAQARRESARVVDELQGRKPRRVVARPPRLVNVVL